MEQARPEPEPEPEFEHRAETSPPFADDDEAETDPEPLVAADTEPEEFVGTLYAARIDDESRKLVEEINSRGHLFNLSKTRLEHKSPSIRTARAEVIGTEAIRRYLKL